MTEVVYLVYKTRCDRIIRALIITETLELAQEYCNNIKEKFIENIKEHYRDDDFIIEQLEEDYAINVIENNDDNLTNINSPYYTGFCIKPILFVKHPEIILK